MYMSACERDPSSVCGTNGSVVQWEETKYVPKSKRWKRMQAMKDSIFETGVKPIVEWISNLEEDWSEYRARVTKEEFKRACKIHHELHKLQEEYAPLGFETWSAPSEGRRKRKYNHPFTRIPVVEAMTKGICGYESVITCQETKDSTSPGMHENVAIFDGDARRVRIDNRASGCISDKREISKGR